MDTFNEFQALFGLGLTMYALVSLYAILWRPKMLSNPILRPRWFGFGPKASRAAAGFGSFGWLTIGIFALGHAFDALPYKANAIAVVLILFFATAAVIAQLTSGDGAA